MIINLMQIISSNSITALHALQLRIITDKISLHFKIVALNQLKYS